MLDSHIHPADWGVRPVLFHIGDFGVPSYTFFVLVALAVGTAVFFYEARKKGGLSEKGLFVALWAFGGGAIGAKVLEWIISYKIILSHFTDVGVWLSGRSIVGGLIGGTVGALLAKKRFNVQVKMGNLFAPAVAIGIAIGRIGCFLRGCCYGIPTTLPWGVDFGDGILRHPTQLYESFYMLGMFVVLQFLKKRDGVKPGELFRLLMVSYFTFRFFIEYIRAGETILAGLTIFQILSIGGILYFGREMGMRLFISIYKYGRKQH